MIMIIVIGGREAPLARQTDRHHASANLGLSRNLGYLDNLGSMVIYVISKSRLSMVMVYPPIT